METPANFSGLLRPVAWIQEKCPFSIFAKVQCAFWIADRRLPLRCLQNLQDGTNDRMGDQFTSSTPPRQD